MSIYRVFMLMHRKISGDTSEIRYTEDVVLIFWDQRTYFFEPIQSACSTPVRSMRQLNVSSFLSQTRFSCFSVLRSEYRKASRLVALLPHNRWISSTRIGGG